MLRNGGLLIDARPDSRRLSGVLHGERAVGTLGTTRDTLVDDRAADRAIARVKREGLFRSRRDGGFMHHVAFAGIEAMQTYLNEHARLVRRVRWRVDAAERRRWRDDTFRIERPIRYELLERLGER
ncbi:MAG TPA: hypothetical protein VI814_05020 [Candidatus Limnocylindria bacterium]